MADRVIEIIVDVADKTSGKLGGIKDGLLALDAAAQRMSNRLRALSTQKYAATLRLIDRVTEPGSRINSFLKGLASKVYSLSIRINDSALGKIRQIEAGVMRLTGKAYTIAVNLKDNVSGKLKGLTEGAMMGAGVFAPIAGAAGIGFGAANALGSYMDVEKQMSRVQAVAMLEKNSPEMQKLTELANKLGAETEWKASDAAQAMYYQAMAGWTPDKILAATPAIVHLASAGGTDLATTSDIITDTMTGFGLKAGERYTDPHGRNVEVAQHYADMMAKLVTSASTNIPQLGEALKYSSNVIGNMFAGKDIQTRMAATEDALVMTGLMANAGIKGSMAGTTTRAVFSRFGAENRNAKYALDALGVDFVDKDTGDVRRISSIMKDLGKRFKEGVDPEQLMNFAEAMTGEKIHADTRRKLNSFIDNASKNGGKLSGADMLKMSSMLAGQEAMSGFLAAIMGDWDELAVKIQDAHGAAEKMADIQLENLAGDVTRLGSAWDAFQRGLFEGQAGEGLRDFVKTLTDIVNRANELFKDGIQIGDIGKLIGDVIGRLKNKFLELDGIGSILAGGALMAGLMKIASTAQRTIGYFRQLRGLEIGQRLGGAGTPPGTPPTTRGAIPPGQSVGTMNVSAGVVNVNGKVNGAGGTGGTGGAGSRRVGDRTIIDRYNRERERIRGTGTPPPPPTPPTPPAPSIFSGMKSAAGGAAAFAAIFGILDVMNQRSMTQERVADAKQQLEMARQDYAEQVRQSAGQEVLREYAQKISDAEALQVKIAQEGKAAEFKAGTEAAGAIAGSALGAALGSLAGPMGTMIGGIIGGMIGQKLGGNLADASEGIRHETAPREVNGSIIEREVEKRTEPPKTFEFKNPLEREERDITGLKKKTFFEPGEQIAATTATAPKTAESSVADFRRANEISYSPEFRRAQREARDAAEHARWQQDFYGEQARRTRGGEFIQGEYKPATEFRGRASTEPTYDFKPTSGQWQPSTTPQPFETGTPQVMRENKSAVEESTSAFQKLGSLFDSLFFNRAAAAELNPEQQAQQAAMERGETVAPENPVAAGELPDMNVDGLTENLFSQLEQFGEGVTEIFTGLGESITEGLTSTFEGVGEIFSTFGETITEGLTATFEGVGEIFSTFGESITEGLTSTFEGVGEIFSTFGEMFSEGLTAMIDGAGEVFSGLGEMISAGLDAALSSATSALEGIQSAFTSTKDAIQSAWAELPGFFDGIFAGLGGVAAAAGAAIYSGLTSVCGAVISAWEAVASTVSSIISSISAAASSVASMIPSIGGGGTGKAEGGFVTAETHFFAGEHGPEVVIPLSSSRRARALDLFEKTAAILGGDPLNVGGDELAQELPGGELSDDFGVPANEHIDAETPVTNQSTSATSNNSVEMGGITVNFEISGAENPQEVMETIKENLAELADKIAGEIAKTVGAIHENQCLDG